jgi:hypothetical protein
VHREIYGSGDPTMLLNREVLSCQALPLSIEWVRLAVMTLYF